MNYLFLKIERFVSRSIAALVIFASVVTTILTLGLPSLTHAIKVLNCSGGATLEIVHDETTAQLGDYVYRCSDGSKNFALTDSPGNECPSGFVKETEFGGGAVTNESICIPDSVSKSLTDTGARPSSSDCGFLNPGACIQEAWNYVVTRISFIPAGIGAAVLVMVGKLFNFLLDHTIITFSTSIVDRIGDGINTAWTAFRDIANIVIIGMFTFIAISLILGIKEYGERRMIARVLIVAVLINFSLLFTKVIIDASNFTALQFYDAAALQTGAASEGFAVGSTVIDNGIAGSFIRSMGITSVGDLLSSLENLQKNEDGNFIQTILFGILTGVFFLLAAAVLLYGAFLLVARALLLIFLMVISPLAFASWLVPKFAQQGWHTWWDSLLRAAVFAPLLMVLLWVSLLITSKFTAEGKTLGSLIADPGNSQGIEALFSYFVVLGMLFLSIKLASKFSGTIAGFSGAIAGAVAPFTLGSRLAAPFLRGTVGLGGYFYQSSRMKQARKARDEAGRLRDEAEVETDSEKKLKLLSQARGFESLAALKLKRAERGGAIAKSKMNLMDTGPAKAATDALGVTGFFAGQSAKATKGFGERVEARAKAAEARAAKLAPSADEQRKMEENFRKQREMQEKIYRAERQNRAAEANAVGTAMEGEKTGKESELKGAKRELEDARLNRETEKIKQATEKIRGIEDRLAKLNEKEFTVSVAREDGTTETVTKSLKNANSERTEAQKKLDEYSAETTKQVVDMKRAVGDAAEEIAEKIGRKEGTVLERTLGAFKINQEVGKQTRDMYKKKRGDARLRRVLADAVKEDGGGEKSPESKGEKK